ncbi:hypothetical protein CYMTET_20455 [Cymbomonas tetramitiformis]|uniref:Uncharacterized protein n=1 Tax=Cymbomonas tetramitiformis TaxID=36881 RepID=A0AAE0G3X9_9CHLO|nr:hypothetical protein CYMTET_20455 [Cymbomonas tetramitiformis]
MDSDEDDDLFVMLDSDGRIFGTSEAVDYSFQSWKKFLTLDSSFLEGLRTDCVISSFPLAEKSFWLSAETTPRMNLEKLARLIFDHHTEGLEFDSTQSGMEWWSNVSHSDKIFRAKDAYGSIDFHFDKDETLHTKHNMFVHPQLSTVTYLTDVGAPTIIFEQRISSTGDFSTSKVSKGFWASPEVGKHVKFDGRFLHGAPAEMLATESAPYTRVTFLVNIWLNHRPADISEFPDHLLSQVGNHELPRPSTVLERLPAFRVCTKTEGCAEEMSFTVTQSGDKEHTLRVKLPLGDILSKELATGALLYEEEYAAVIVEKSEENPCQKKRRLS